MALFSRQKPPLLGIEISSTAVKLVELSSPPGMPHRVESYAIEPLPVGTMADNRITDLDKVGQAIKRAVRQSGTTAKQAAIAVAGPRIITKTIHLPTSLSGRELESRVEMEAGQHMPFSLAEASMDFAVLGPSRKNGKIDVLLVATHIDHVNERVAALELAGLQARIVDLADLAVERACHHLLPQPERRTIAILDMGAYTTRLYAPREGEPIYTSEQAFGGQQLTTEIQHQYGLSHAEAELAKRQNRLPAQLLHPFQQKIAEYAGQAIQRYASARPHNQLNVLLLAGGCLLLTGALAAIRHKTGLPTGLINPFAGLQTANRVTLACIQQHAPAMLVAYGLALRRFD